VSFTLSIIVTLCIARLIWVDFRRLEIETPTLMVLGTSLLLQSALLEDHLTLLIRTFAAGAFYATLIFLIRHVPGLGRVGAGDPPLIGLIAFMVFPFLIPWSIVAAALILITSAAYSRIRRKRFLRSMFPAAPPLLLSALPFYFSGLSAL